MRIHFAAVLALAVGLGGCLDDYPEIESDQLASTSATVAYWQYLAANRCQTASQDNCLEMTSYIATRSSGRKVRVGGVYRPRRSDQPPGMLAPHFLHQYMKKLRNAYAADPDTYLNQLYNQIDFLVTDAVDRDGALVWENSYGYAQGMEQAEYAAFFASAAREYDIAGRWREARGTMNYALRFKEALAKPAGVHTGGVRSQTEKCGAKRARFRDCFWFHSRGRGVDAGPGPKTVLNQHFHVLRDVLSLYLSVYRAPHLVDPQFGTADEVLDELVDLAVGGLYHLAFSAGHKAVAPNRPPNIQQFMNYKGTTFHYYWAFYEFHMDSGLGGNIKPRNTCHYHTHTLNLAAGIWALLEDFRYEYLHQVEPPNEDRAHGWRLFEAMDRLFEGAPERIGAPDSTNALYQFFWSELLFKYPVQGCPTDDDTLEELHDPDYLFSLFYD